MGKHILVGNAWPYANSSLHLGHIAGLISGDILARYHRLKGDEVMFVSGSDCHGTPITEIQRCLKALTYLIRSGAHVTSHETDIVQSIFDCRNLYRRESQFHGLLCRKFPLTVMTQGIHPFIQEYFSAGFPDDQSDLRNAIYALQFIGHS